MAERFFAALEGELIDRQRFNTQAEARMAVFESSRAHQGIATGGRSHRSIATGLSAGCCHPWYAAQ